MPGVKSRGASFREKEKGNYRTEELGSPKESSTEMQKNRQEEHQPLSR